MKVLVVTPWYPNYENNISGIFIQHQVKVLAQEHQIKVVFIRNNYNQFKFFPQWQTFEDNSDSFPVFHISIPRSFPVYNQANYLYSAFRATIDAIKEPPEIIHAHVAYPAGVLAMWLSYYWKVPYVVTAHRGPIETLFRSKIHKYLAIKALNNAQRVIAVSQSYRNDISGYFKTPIEVIPNIIEANRFKLHQKKNGPFSFGFLGGLNTQIKNLDLLLSAFKQLDDDESCLYIGGGGRLLETYRKKSNSLGLAKRCHFLGNISPSKIFSFYNQLDVFIITSNYESFNVSGIEAMACGLPVISTRCGGPQDYIHENNGLLIPRNDVDALVTSMRYIQKNYYRYIDENIREEILKKYDGEIYMTKLNKTYRDVLEK